MTLSREVPVKIKTCLHSFLRDLISKSPYQLADIIKHSIFAIHPGGPKIIDSIQDTLGLADAQLRISREVLFENGNMSSATLPFVWQKLLEQNIESKQLVVSLAFGPGLTIFGALFETI
jgi:alkylresorcinol/alkylpyrone synthase